MKVLAVGDIHTKTWILYEIAELVDFYDAVVFVGDYADNWNTPPPQTLATWRLLKELTSNPKVHAVIGNHDYAYIHPEIAGRSSGWNPVTYTLINTPEKKKIKEWLLSLPVTLELDGVTFSHAGITEEWDGKEDVRGLWNDNSPIWARPGNVHYKKIPQVIGHTPTDTCMEIWDDVWSIDTFSEHQDNTPIGDHSLLEIIDGKEFNVLKLKEIHENNSDTAGVEDKVS